MAILWLDNNADDFPIVGRLAEQEAVSIIPKYTVAEALECLDSERPACLILDLIVPFGNPREAGLSEEGRTFLLERLELGNNLEDYTGLLLLEYRPALAARTIVLSIVSEDKLHEQIAQREVAAVFHKSHLGIAKEEFRRKIREVAKLGKGT